MPVRSIRTTLMLLCGGLLWSCSGCGWQAWQGDVDIAGTWQLAAENTEDLGNTTLSFDAEGNLAQLTITVCGIKITPDSFNAEVVVNGNSVVIESTFSGNTLKFEGTLNTDSQVVEGKLSLQVDLGLAKITISGGNATLTKQEQEQAS